MEVAMKKLEKILGMRSKLIDHDGDLDHNSIALQIDASFASLSG